MVSSRRTVASMATESGEHARSKRSLLKGKKNRAFVKDDRFESVLSDPRFDSLARKDRKVVIDKRFKSMLTNEKFGTKCAVDMRGRRVNVGTANTLGQLYDLDDSTSEKGDSDMGMGEDEREIRIDLARGDGNITSSDEDSGSEWSFDDEGNAVEHKWGELDGGATHVESATRRLALCNNGGGIAFLRPISSLYSLHSSRHLLLRFCQLQSTYPISAKND
uniref:ESF1 n=1 Tax=Ascaris suum TaxID=6253 RepID=F1KT92_ASCSU